MELYAISTIKYYAGMYTYNPVDSPRLTYNKRKNKYVIRKPLL